MELRHDPRVRELLGVYLLGACDDADRQLVEAHLRDCQACRLEVDSLGRLPDALRQLPERELAQGWSQVRGSLLAGLLARSRRRVVRDRRRLRAWQASTAAGLAAAAVALIMLAPWTSAGRSVALQPMAVSVHATGSVSLEQRPWGTQLVLRVSGLPVNYAVVAWVKARDGTRTEVGSWMSIANRQVLVELASSIPVNELSSLTVDTSSGRPLLSAKL